MNSKSKKSKLDPASFVVVANRLPVDRVEHPDGTADWRPSPGGLVTAFEPIMRRRQAPGSDGMEQPTRNWRRLSTRG